MNTMSRLSLFVMLFAVFFCTEICSAQKTDSLAMRLKPVEVVRVANISNAEALKFYKTELFDTLYNSSVFESHQYFPFINLGSKPLFIEKVIYSDPDYACVVPKQPIEPLQSDSIGVCLVDQQLHRRINRTYWVQYKVVGDDSVYSQKLTLKNVVANGEKCEWNIISVRDRRDVRRKIGTGFNYKRLGQKRSLELFSDLGNMNKEPKSIVLDTLDNEYDKAIQFVRSHYFNDVIRMPINSVEISDSVLKTLADKGVLVRDTIIIDVRKQQRAYSTWRKSFPSPEVDLSKYEPTDEPKAQEHDYSNGEFAVYLTFDDEELIIASFLSKDIYANTYGLKDYWMLFELNRSTELFKGLHADEFFSKKMMSRMIADLCFYY
jgi:hypothetical protein